MQGQFSHWFVLLVSILPPDYKDAPKETLELECLDMYNEGRTPREAADLIVELDVQKRVAAA